MKRLNDKWSWNGRRDSNQIIIKRKEGWTDGGKVKRFP